MAASLWMLPQLPLHSSLVIPSKSACPPLPRHRNGAAARGDLDLLLCPCSGASSSAVTKEQQAASEEAPEPPALVSYKDDPSFRGCRGCGRAQIERGCNGQGRIQGGIAAVPGLGWWPIKAYRPCPGFVASGGRYRRQGQSMDDVASGRGKKAPSAKNKSSAAFF